MKWLIASDHAGVDLKNELIRRLPEVTWQDLGPSTKDSVDYPDFADKVGKTIDLNPASRGVLICGSGQGMAMRANKYRNVRAALCWNTEVAELSRAHNDANILCLGARFLDLDTAVQIFKTFLNTPFEGGRHARRVEKVSSPIEC